MSVYSTQVATDGASAYWRMDDAGPNLAPTVGAVTLTPLIEGTGAAILYQQAALDSDTGVIVAGTEPNGNSFQGASNAALDLGDVFTLEAWIKRSSDAIPMDATGGARQNIFCKGSSSGGNGYQLDFESATGLLQLLVPEVTVMCSSTRAIQDNGWHHIVATKTGAAIKLYIDAVDVTGAITNNTCANNTFPLRVGRRSTSASQFFNGELQDLALYKSVLTPAQVNNHFFLHADTKNSVATRTAVAAALTLGLSVATGTNRLLVANVAMRVSSAQSIAGIVWTALGQTPQSLSPVNRTAQGAGTVAVETWRLLAPTVGAGTLVATMNSGQTVSFALAGHVFNNIDQVTPIDQVTTNIGSSNAPSLTTISVAGDTVLDVVASQDSAITMAANGGQTQQWQEHSVQTATASNLRGASSTKPGAASVVTGYALSATSPWAIQSVSLKPSGAAVTRQALIAYEALKGLSPQALLAYEALKPISPQTFVAYEAILPVTASRAAVYETLSAPTRQASVIYEAIQGAVQTGTIPYEVLTAPTRQAAIVYEALRTASAQAGTVYEVLKAFFARSLIAYEGGIPTGAVTPVTVQAFIVWEALKPLLATGLVAYEALTPRSRTSLLAYEALSAPTVQRAVNYEALKPITQQRQAAYEALKALSPQSLIAYEALGAKTKQGIIVYETLKKPQGLALIAYEGGVPGGVVAVFQQTPLDIIEHDHSLFSGVSLYLDVMLSSSDTNFSAVARLEVSTAGVGGPWTVIATASTNALPVLIASGVFIGTRVRSAAAAPVPNQSALYRVTLGGLPNSGANRYVIYHGWGLISE